MKKCNVEGIIGLVVERHEDAPLHFRILRWGDYWAMKIVAPVIFFLKFGPSFTCSLMPSTASWGALPRTHSISSLAGWVVPPVGKRSTSSFAFPPSAPAAR